MNFEDSKMPWNVQQRSDQGLFSLEGLNVTLLTLHNLTHESWKHHRSPIIHSPISSKNKHLAEFCPLRHDVFPQHKPCNAKIY